MQLAPSTRALLDGWQRGFPLVSRPFAAIADALGESEASVIETLGALAAAGVLSRIGAAVRPNTAGASLLAAMRVPAADLDRVAAIVSAEPTVNHNYEREHDFNLWFVVAAPDRAGLRTALARLTAATGLAILELPMERPYYLDLGFPLEGRDSGWKRGVPALPSSERAPSSVAAEDRALLAAIEDGLPLVPRPYQAVARRLGTSEGEVIRRLAALIGAGIVSRFGVIVRHRALGIAANAMTVWDIPDRDVDEIGQRLAAEPAVTLCYRRPRRLPDWPYNLFAMVHGSARAEVLAEIAGIAGRLGIADVGRAVLFSTRCFAQRGARFKAA